MPEPQRALSSKRSRQDAGLERGPGSLGVGTCTILPQRNKTTDTEARPTAYVEGSYHSLGVRILAIHLSEREMFLDTTETPLCLVGQKSSTGEPRGAPQVKAWR